MSSIRPRVLSCLLPALTAAILIAAAGRAGAQDWRYTVAPGDTLWTISERFLLSRSYWRRLQTLNRIGDPRRLIPGSQLRLPADWLRMDETTARVEAVQGEVVVLGANGARVALEPGQSLTPGSVVRTGADASLLLRFEDGSELLLTEQAVIELQQLRGFAPLGVGRTRIDLRDGGVEVNLPPSRYRSGSRFEIKTRAATLAVRGTRYRARVPAAEQALSEVLRGQVLASNERDRQRLPALFGLAATAGQPLPPPQRLLPAPDLSALAASYDRVPLTLALTPPPGAEQWRVQIAATPEFERLLFDARSRGPVLSGPDLPDGDYFLRARGIAPDGVEGLDAVTAIVVNARPEPPIQVRPVADAVVRETAPEFVWARSEAAVAYHFQLASDPRFTAPLVDVDTLSGSALSPDTALAPGEYYWRVASLGPGDDRGPFGDPARFTLRPAPQSPELQAPELDHQQMAFRWRSGAPGQRYQFQLARDYFFADLIADEVLDEPQITLPRLDSGLYFMRLRVIDSDGYRGEFGPRQELRLAPDMIWPAVVAPGLLWLLFAL